jgi:hypothetical protein
LRLLTAILGAILFSTGALDKNESELNILLLTVDSFRPDCLGCYGAERAHTPNIDRLARRGVIFTRAYSTAAWTNASLVSMLTGLYPSVHGVERRGVSLTIFSQHPTTAISGLRPTGSGMFRNSLLLIRIPPFSPGTISTARICPTTRRKNI